MKNQLTPKKTTTSTKPAKKKWGNPEIVKIEVKGGGAAVTESNAGFFS